MSGIQDKRKLLEFFPQGVSYVTGDSECAETPTGDGVETEVIVLKATRLVPIRL
jgi:hypothetical protein